MTGSQPHRDGHRASSKTGRAAQQAGKAGFTGGLSPFKRKALDPFIHSIKGPAIHCMSLETAVKGAGRRRCGGSVGIIQTFAGGRAAMRFEDGFIRSRGLGANLTLPCSLAMDGQYPYYDARGESRLEHILANHVSMPD